MRRRDGSVREWLRSATRFTTPHTLVCTRPQAALNILKLLLCLLRGDERPHHLRRDSVPRVPLRLYIEVALAGDGRYAARGKMPIPYAAADSLAE